MEGLELAARVLDQFWIKGDSQWPSLFSSLTSVDSIGKTGFRSVSGHLESDYPMAIERKLLPESIFSIEYKAALPQELEELLNQPDVNACKMGLFPQIYRAWMSIDSDFYIWDFRDGSDLSFYDGLKDNILAVEMVTVKPAVFRPSIQHLLCVTTPTQIVILGFKMECEDGAQNKSHIFSIELISQPIFALSTEGTIFPVIHGSSNGRIFLGASDGSLHEICYRAGRGWLRDRAWKVNLSQGYFSYLFGTPLKYLSGVKENDEMVQIAVDNTRKLLFTRSKTGAIQAFDLGSDFDSFQRVGSFDFHAIVKEIMNVSRNTLEPTTIRKILSISVIEYGELNLVAITDSGFRIYFSCYNTTPEPLMSVGADLRPTGLHLVHIRLPPGYCARSSLKKPSNSHLAFSTPGIYALAQHIGQEQDCIWLMAPSPYPSPLLSEISTIHGLPGVVLDIQNIVSEEEGGMESWLRNLPSIVTQHLPWTRRIVILTGNGTVVYKSAKPYEILKDLILEYLEREEVMRGHFEMASTRDQPLSNCLLLATHPFINGTRNVQDSAAKAFLHFGKMMSMPQEQSQGGQPFYPTSSVNPPSTSTSFDGSRAASPGTFDGSTSFNPGLVSTPATSPAGHRGSNLFGPSPASSSFNQWGAGSKVYPKTNQPQSGQVSQAQPIDPNWPYSPRHDALYLLVSRILLPFWNKTLVRTGFVQTDGNQTKIVTPNIQGEEVSYAIVFLSSVHTFINNNPSLYFSRNPPLGSTSPPMIGEMEKTSISALKNFIGLTLEVLGMWKILCDHQFHIILHGIDDRLANSSMRDLVLTGHATVTVIINALISKYLGDNAAVDAISLRLREVCPTLFKNEDAIGSKVAEILSKARSVQDPVERRSMLDESLALVEEIQSYGRVNIKNFCSQYSDLGYPRGTVRLCAAVAKASDPEDLALNSLRISSNNPMGQLAPSIQNALQVRSSIYKLSFEALDHFVGLSATRTSPHLRRSAEEERRVLPAQLAREYADELIAGILATNDELFHVGLYNWLLERKLFDRLLEIKHPFLDSFLQRAGEAVVTGRSPPGLSDGSNDIRVLDLLWRHHEMNGNHSAAALILSRLADSTTTGLDLNQRIEYLSRAIMSTKACLRKGEGLETLEDKLEVAQIQRSTLDALESKFKYVSVGLNTTDEDLKNYQDALSKLNSGLFDLTRIYTDFAMPFKLHDVKLDILYSAGHSDKQMIDTLWADIIEAELKLRRKESMESQMESIGRKLVTLGRKFIQSPVFFPVEYLVEHLEAMKPSENVDLGWVFKTMLAVGVEFPDLLHVYESIWRKAVARQRDGNDLAIARVIVEMINGYVRKELVLRSGYEYRKELIGRCKGLAAMMMVEFSARFDEKSIAMKNNLSEVNCRLERAS